MNARQPAGLGGRIKRARERKRWKQQQLADALGVNRKTIDNWENNRTSPRSSIGALEEVLGVSLADDEPEPRPPALSPELQAAMRAEVGDEMASRLIAHAEHLASGRTAPAEDGPPRESGGTDRRTAG